MNKKILFIVIGILMTYFSKAQKWDSVGTGPGGWAEAICTYNGNLIVGGLLGGTYGYGVTQWNGTSWSPIGTGMNVQFPGHYVSALTTYSGNLIAGGAFDTAGGIYTGGIARWNGTSWSTIGTIVDPTFVVSLVVYNGNLYAGGAFSSIGGTPASNIAEWNGTTWSPLGAGIKGSGLVFSLAVYNGELYAGGTFDSAGGIPVNNIAKWNGSSWSAVGGGIATVYSLCEYEGNLYAGTSSNIAMWDGTSWSVPGGGITGGSVYALTVYNHELFAGGNFWTAGSYNAVGVAQWDGYSWSPLSNEQVTPNVFSLEGFDSALIVGGNFTTIGTSSYECAAKWTGNPLPESKICYVTADTASKYNEVFWDKTGVDTNLVDSFRVYSKSFINYKYLGSVSVHNYTEFIDSSSQPNTSSSSYKISTVDTSGLLSHLTTSYDQTILLQANIGIGNVVNLSWNPYIGDSVLYYVVLRDSTGLGHWQRFDSVPNNIYAFTDNHPPVTPNLRYVVNTVWHLSCVPYAPHALRKNRLMSVNEVTSRSNRKELSIVTSISTVNSLPSIAIYPNPANNQVTITLSQPVNGVLTVCDVFGRDICTNRITSNETAKQIDLSGISNGIYFLKLSLGSGGQVVKKIEVIK